MINNGVYGSMNGRGGSGGGGSMAASTAATNAAQQQQQQQLLSSLQQMQLQQPAYTSAFNLPSFNFQLPTTHGGVSEMSHELIANQSSRMTGESISSNGGGHGYHSAIQKQPVHTLASGYASTSQQLPYLADPPMTHTFWANSQPQSQMIGQSSQQQVTQAPMDVSQNNMSSHQLSMAAYSPTMNQGPYTTEYCNTLYSHQCGSGSQVAFHPITQQPTSIMTSGSSPYLPPSTHGVCYSPMTTTTTYVDSPNIPGSVGSFPSPIVSTTGSSHLTLPLTPTVTAASTFDSIISNSAQMNGYSSAAAVAVNAGSHGVIGPQFPSFPSSAMNLNQSQQQAMPPPRRTSSWSSLTQPQQTRQSPVMMNRTSPVIINRPSPFGKDSSRVLIVTFIHAWYQEAEHEPTLQAQRVAAMKGYQSTPEFKLRQEIATTGQDPRGQLQAILAEEASGYFRIPTPTLDEVYGVFSTYGAILRLICYFKDGLCKCLIEYADPLSAANAKHELDGKELSSTITQDRWGKMRVGFSQYTHIQVDEMQKAKGQGRDYESEGRETSTVTNPTVVQDADETSNPVLKISGLSNKTTLEHLKGLFCLYGPIAKSKFCYYGKSSALIEFDEAQDAKLAYDCLQGVPLFQHPLQIQYSRHESVSFNKESDQAQGATYRDYSQDRDHHIYGLNGSQTMKMLASSMNLFLPTTVLCVHDVPMHLPSSVVFNKFASSVIFPPNRFHELVLGASKCIFLFFPHLPAGVDALAQHQNQTIADVRGDYVFRISFAPTQHELYGNTTTATNNIAPKMFPSPPKLSQAVPSTAPPKIPPIGRTLRATAEAFLSQAPSSSSRPPATTGTSGPQQPPLLTFPFRSTPAVPPGLVKSVSSSIHRPSATLQTFPSVEEKHLMN